MAEKIPFWEASYQNDAISAFGSAPNPEIREFLPLFPKNGKVLEAGCGEAKNSFYLLEHGFSDVSAFDISSNAIRKVKRIAENRNLNIRAFQADLTQFAWEDSYDLIVTYGTLHFVSSDGWHKFLREAKEHTVPGGFHVVQIFTNKVPASDDIKDFAIGLAEEGELLTLYRDWEIVFHKEFILEDEHPGALKHFHAINKIVVKKSRIQ